MSTSIEWTNVPGFKGETWNPVRGCDKISPGCKNCYAKTFAERWRGIPGHPYEQGFDMRLVPGKLAQPLLWTKPRSIFVNSMSDMFHEGVPFEYVAAVFGVAAATRQHIHMMLTKRSERMVEFFEHDRPLIEMAGLADELISKAVGMPGHLARRLYGHFDEEMGETDVPWPLPNAWMGVSVEDRKHGLPRIDHLRRIPAVVRMLSIEPLLEDLGEFDLTGIHWVIIGGESGHDARPCAVEWIERIIAQCRQAGVPVFVKQLGAYVVSEERMLDGNWAWRAGLEDRKGGDIDAWPDELRVREWPHALALAA